MDLTHTPEQQELKDAVRRFCQEQITMLRLDAWDRTTRGIDEQSWQAIGALGWFGLGVPATAGGSGLGLVECACLLEECARGLVPRGVVAAIRGAWALARLAPEVAELAEVVTGARTVTLACDEEGARDPARYTTRLEGGKNARLSGTKVFVPDGANADYFIVAAREGADAALCLTARAAAHCEPVRSFDGDRQAQVTFASASVLRRLTVAGAGGDALRLMQREQAALALAEMLGTMDAALDMTVKYVKEREQFGQKIAVFQAVQHQVADMGTALTAGRHLAWRAITRLANGQDSGGDLEAALAYVAPACRRVTLTAHHLHGGAGFVLEHPLHLHAERAHSLSIRYAPEATTLAAVATRLLD
jgi:alkylation response protein AidB-like acyl-CoA dehydrogenase